MLKPYLRVWRVSDGIFVAPRDVEYDVADDGKISAPGHVISLGTGARDSRGVSIYDGDIVRPIATESKEFVGYISYTDGTFAIYRDGRVDRDLSNMLRRAPKMLTIIGTIYTSPELVSGL